MAGPLRVASVPAGHPYVRHLSDPEMDPSDGGELHSGLPGPVPSRAPTARSADDVVRLADPPVPGAPPGQWWPSPLLEADWVGRHRHDFDLFHLHFGFEDRSPAQLGALVSALRAAAKPLVVTVHDLQNPHHADPAAHGAALDVLVPAADQVITLTAGAAREIARRWQRAATVIPHPHLVGLERMSRPRSPHAGFVVGLHAKSERANNDSVGVARALAQVLLPLPDAVLRIDVHDDPRGRAVAAELDGLDVRMHPRFSDDELWDYLSGLDLSVLPYRFGTHSGWLEACRDLGTVVLAPSCGYYADQGPCAVYRRAGSEIDRASLAAAVGGVYHHRPDHRASPAARRTQRAAIARAHRRVYEAALDARAAAVPG